MIKVDASLQVAPVDRRGSTGGLKVPPIILTKNLFPHYFPFDAKSIFTGLPVLESLM